MLAGQMSSKLIDKERQVNENIRSGYSKCKPKDKMKSRDCHTDYC